MAITTGITTSSYARDNAYDDSDETYQLPAGTEHVALGGEVNRRPTEAELARQTKAQETTIAVKPRHTVQSKPRRGK